MRVRVSEFGSTIIKRGIPLKMFQDEMPLVIVSALVVALMLCFVMRCDAIQDSEKGT